MHDKYDAGQHARLYRAGELTTIRIPSEAEERVRDVVRCRETLQREVVKSRIYIIKFLARRGFIYRAGLNWRPAHYTWLRQLTGRTSPLAPEDRLVFGEYFALLEYKLSRRDALDHHIEELAQIPAYAPAVATLQCFRGPQVHRAMVLATELVDWREPACGGLRRRANSWRISALCRANIPVARVNDADPSRKRETRTVVTCWCRPLGPIASTRRLVPRSRCASAANRPPSCCTRGSRVRFRQRMIQDLQLRSYSDR